MSVAETKAVLDKIGERGYWKVVVRPLRFVPDRVKDRSDLYPIIRNCSVRFRGWDYPHLEPQERGTVGPDWVGQEFEWDSNLEFWRFYQSGLYYHRLGIEEDWRDQSDLLGKDDDWRPMKTLWELDALYQFTEIFEFVTRLAMSPAGGDAMRVEITTARLEGRTLRNDRTKHALGSYQPLSCGPDCSQTFTLSLIQAITEPRELALKAADHLIRHFGVEHSPFFLREMQKQLIR